MAVCEHCGKEMKEADSCSEPLDKSSLPPDEFHSMLGNCRDCGVAPGACHHPGCGAEPAGAKLSPAAARTRTGTGPEGAATDGRGSGPSMRSHPASAGSVEPCSTTDASSG